MSTLSPELSYASLTAGLTCVMWVPIVVNRLREMGPWRALKNPQPDVRPEADWAYRLASAHRNALENLAVFAPLALAVHVLGLGTSATATAAAVFFWTRLAHVVIYTLGVPLLRTLAFAAGFCAQVVLAVRIFSLI